MDKSRLDRYKVLKLDEFRWKIILKGTVIGIVAGFGAVLYRLEVEHGLAFAQKAYLYLKANPLSVLLWICAIPLIGLVIGWMVKKEPMASGSGIPQVEGILLFGLKMKWYVVLAVRYICGFLGAIFGLSLGREGPTIQIGAAASQGVSEVVANGKLEKDLLITGGAAAGLAAAFNAPLSGMVFALEEVHRSFSPNVLLVAAAASLVGDIVSKDFFGLKPVLYFAQIPQLQVNQYVWLIPAAILFGLVGSVINKMLLLLQTAYSKMPWYLRCPVALLIALPFGLFLPSVLGSGQNLIKLAENTNNTVNIIAILLICKLVFTCTSFGSGTPGGIFMPILAIGALSGSLFGIVIARFGLPRECIPIWAVCGMAGAMASSVKAPITSILLTAEMSGSLVHLCPVAVCAFIALFVSDMLNIEPIYEALLHRYLGKNKREELEREKGKGHLFEVPVEMGCSIANQRIKDVQLPQGCLIINVVRGTKELVPDGNTRIMPGDYLLILSRTENSVSVREAMNGLCHFG